MVTLTVDQLARCTGATLLRASGRIQAYNDAMQAYNLDATPQRAAMFLANVGHECGGFAFPSEIWGPTSAQKRYERNQSAPWPTSAEEALHADFALNRLAWRLGNWRTGDGYLYRGRGDFETTGRGNYARLTARLRARSRQLVVPDFEASPDALLDPQWAALSAADYADMMRCNVQADAGNFDAYCDLVNLGRVTKEVGDSNGYVQRVTLLHAGYAAFGIQ